MPRSAKPTTPAKRYHPIDSMRWTDPATLYSNDYNPNHVFGPELALLKLSMLEDGWTAPVYAMVDGMVIDGFHRWTLGLKDDDIRAMSGGLVPVVFADRGKTRADCMKATIRHNRARGQHGILAMGKIVRELAEKLGEAEVVTALGMEIEEFERLSDMRGSPEHAGKDSFGKGWVPTRDAPKG